MKKKTYNAYWVSPDGEMLPVKSTHIEEVIKNPATFGLTSEYIREVYKKYGETFRLEGNARDEIVENLISKKWMRIRYDKGLDYYIVGIKYFERDQLDYLIKWGKSLINLDATVITKEVYFNNMTSVLAKCTIEQLVNGYLNKSFNHSTI